MPADSEQLKQTLDQLHRQLSEIGRVGPGPATTISSPRWRKFSRRLKRGPFPPANPLPSESLMHRLGEAARHFEESHPTLAGTIGGLIDTLGRSGI